ncbi:MAG: conjugative transposon protein TraM [Sphingobacteriales bacterium]
MEQQTLTPKMSRQRRFLFVLPLLLLPFLTLFFWAAGGGRRGTGVLRSAREKGMNVHLPDAHIKDERALNKMSYYDQAALDSAKLKQEIKSDPYYRQHTDTASGRQRSLFGLYKDSSLFRPAISDGSNLSANENRVYRKLAEVQRAVSQPEPPASNQEPDRSVQVINKEKSDGLESDRQQPAKQPSKDREMQQMDGLLEKVLDIQHPDRVNEQLRENSEAQRGRVFSVRTTAPVTPVSLLTGAVAKPRGDSDTAQMNGFYSLGEPAAPETGNAIAAVIDETQTVVNGSVVRLRLTEPVFINGVMIPKDHFLFGLAALNGERLNIKITGIRYLRALFPVALAVYDMDGLEGIEIPGAIGRDVAKESAAASVQNLGLTNFDPSFAAQATGAGLEAAKTLFTRKVKLIKVVVKGGYQVLLKDEKAIESSPGHVK